MEPLREVRRAVRVDVEVRRGAHQISDERAADVDRRLDDEAAAAAAALVAVAAGSLGDVEVEVGDGKQLGNVGNVCDSCSACNVCNVCNDVEVEVGDGKPPCNVGNVGNGV